MVEWAKERDPADVYRFLSRLFSLCSPMCLPKKLSISGASLEEFPLITRYAENLTTLKIPWSFIANETVIREARKLSSLHFLDLSYTYGIGARAIEAIGKHCRLLTGFHRYMLLDFKDHYYDDEARAIAATMHGLKSLEINHFKFISHTSVLKILSSCTKLDYLDLRQSYIIGPGEKLPQYFSSRTLQKCSGRYDVFIR
ncbi:LRR domain containing protein [Trema orientale]|uniref:LRR domain containing protein n=1 Tax=Trema orientale TaxID=63057 RepID=A0A2P5FYN2_TREOI|nr:LRR domain containing protein [Trema orientale]